MSHPEAVAAIHDRDSPPARMPSSPTPSAPIEIWLARFGQVQLLESINRRAPGWLAPPPGRAASCWAAWGRRRRSEPGAAAEQAGILADEGVDALLFETFRFPEVEPVLAEVAAALGNRVPLFISLWQWPDPAAPAARRLIELGASVLGLNCQPGAAAALAFAERMAAAGRVPLLVKPGIGASPGRGDESRPPWPRPFPGCSSGTSA